MSFLKRLFLASALCLGMVPFTLNGVAAAGSIDGSSCGQQVRIIDISSYQPSINWTSVTGIAGVYIKATEGTGYTNPFMGSPRAGASSVGIPTGFYDFARPSGGVDQAVAEADYFVQAYGTSTLPPMLDLEVSSLDPNFTAIWAAYWVAEVKAKTGRTPIVYSGAYYPFTDAVGNALAPQGIPLWLAAYTSGYSHVAGDSSCNTPQPTSSSSWPGWSVWQFTSVGDLAGIPYNVDVSSVTPQWWAYATGGTVATTASNSGQAAVVYTIGATGTAVISIQNALNFWENAGLVVDGNYGQATFNSVYNFQVNVLHIAGDGQWGPATQAAFVAFLNYMKALNTPVPAPTPAPTTTTTKPVAKPVPTTTTIPEPLRPSTTVVKHCKSQLLVIGSTGSCVTFAQSRLQAAGYPVAQDGIYGAQDSLATASIQHLHHWAATGRLGIRVWGVLMP